MLKPASGADIPHTIAISRLMTRITVPLNNIKIVCNTIIKLPKKVKIIVVTKTSTLMGNCERSLVRRAITNYKSQFSASSSYLIKTTAVLDVLCTGEVAVGHKQTVDGNTCYVL